MAEPISSAGTHRALEQDGGHDHGTPFNPRTTRRGPGNLANCAGGSRQASASAPLEQERSRTSAATVRRFANGIERYAPGSAHAGLRGVAGGAHTAHRHVHLAPALLYRGN